MTNHPIFTGRLAGRCALATALLLGLSVYSQTLYAQESASVPVTARLLDDADRASVVGESGNFGQVFAPRAEGVTCVYRMRAEGTEVRDLNNGDNPEPANCRFDSETSAQPPSFEISCVPGEVVNYVTTAKTSSAAELANLQFKEFISGVSLKTSDTCPTEGKFDFTADVALEVPSTAATLRDASVGIYEFEIQF